MINKENMIPLSNDNNGRALAQKPIGIFCVRFRSEIITVGFFGRIQYTKGTSKIRKRNSGFLNDI